MKYTLDTIKTGEGIIDELGVRMVLHKGKIYISSHGTNIFSGAIYILDDKRYLYPTYNENQCWGYNIVSNGDELAVSGHCDRIYTGYVEILSQCKRRILMRGVNFGDACGFDISWYDGMWWVSCKYKIWNEKDGFISLIPSIDFPIFQYDNTVLNIYDSNSIRLGNEELIGCYKKDVYESGNCIVEYRYGGILRKTIISDSSFFGTSLYITENQLIIGSNNSVNIYTKDFLQSVTIPIPSISNTRFSYLHRDDILYLGSFSSNDLSGVIYVIKYEFDNINNNIILPDPNSDNVNIIIYIIIIIFISMVFILLFIFLYYMIKLCCTSPVIFKKKKDKKCREVRIERRNEGRLLRLNTPEMLQEMYNTRYIVNEYSKFNDDKKPVSPLSPNLSITPDLPGAYKCY